MEKQKNQDIESVDDFCILQQGKSIILQDVELCSSTRESYKKLRTSLLYTEDVKTIAITSTLPNEGKSVTAYHLAVCFAKAGKRTLFIDCDLRKSDIYTYLHVEKNLQGLSEYLSKQASALIYNTSLTNLSIIFSGKTPPNPSELLTSIHFEKLLNILKEKFDYIIIDTPPVSSAVDSSIVGRYVDGVVLVVRSNYVKRAVVDNSKKVIQRNGGRIVGVVLNRLDHLHDSYYGYYGES